MQEGAALRASEALDRVKREKEALEDKLKVNMAAAQRAVVNGDRQAGENIAQLKATHRTEMEQLKVKVRQVRV